MPSKISDIVAQYGISRDDLSALHKKVTGKAFTAKSVNIKDEDLKAIEKELGGSKKTEAKKPAAKKATKAGTAVTKEAKDDSKVLKGDELFGGDDFLSGLGFGAKKEKEVVEEEVEEKTEVEPAEEEIKVSFGNAKVILSAPISTRSPSERKGSKSRESRRPAPAGDTQSFERRTSMPSESAGKTFHTFSNTSFTRGGSRPGQGRPGAHKSAAPAAPAAPKVVREAAVS